MTFDRTALLACLLTVAFPASLQAVTHDVTVWEGWFEPYFITIAVGDTVRWTNNRRGNHDVTADDGSWGSERGSVWTYERTFTAAGDNPYYCGVHASPGKVLGSVMNGMIRVQAEEPALAINPGLSDAWYDPQTVGQGFFIIVWEDVETIFLSWFTYDTERPPANVTAHLGEPGHRWLTAQGPYAGDTATLTVYETAGGVFDSAQPAPGPSTEIGTITLSWSGCNAGELSYELPGHGLAGTIPIERIVLDNVPLCETLGAP